MPLGDKLPNNPQIGIAKAAYQTLNIAALVGLEGTSLLNWFNWLSRLWAVVGGLSETLFDAGRRKAASETALAGYDGTVANYRQTVLTGFQHVEDNVAALHVLSTESEQQRMATASAEESLQLSSKSPGQGFRGSVWYRATWFGLRHAHRRRHEEPPKICGRLRLHNPDCLRLFCDQLIEIRLKERHLRVAGSLRALGLIPEHHRRFRLLVPSRPFRKALAVGVAVGGEVHPI